VIGAPELPPLPEPEPAPEWVPQPDLSQQSPQVPEASVAGYFSVEAPPAVREEAVPADALMRKNPYGDRLMRRMGLGMRKVVGTTAANDIREMADLNGRLIRPVSTCRQIAMVSVRGGAGKTTLAALIATVIAEHRNDRVLAVDAETGFGSLPLRLGATPQKSVHDLASAHPRTWDESSSYLTQVAQRLWVLSGTTGGRLERELDLDTFRSAFGGLGRYFSASVIDCGAGILGDLQQGILATAHAQLLVTPATVDGAYSARSAVEWFQANGHAELLSRTVIALVTHTPHADADIEQLQTMLSAGGLTVTHLPYDRHLATGTALDMERIGAATRAAATRIAADVFSRTIGGVG
jgi:MinD-like ATPase involved in chromosome partitioning or flagellar assembly